MANVYFIPLEHNPDEKTLSAAGRKLLETLTASENLSLAGEIPLKLHFGERGNFTFLTPGVYDGMIDFLEERNIKSAFTETSVLYGGERFNREKHTALALSHGFTRLPVFIADGAKGEEAVEIPVDLHHFKSVSIASGLAKHEQCLVVSHFKGHMLAGFGGAIKQLSMGFASKGGKMAMHLGVKPRIIKMMCKKCGACQKRCQVGAISCENGKFRIDHSKCIGCGACFSICPAHAVSIFSLGGFWNALFKGRFFREKLVEYACGSAKGKKHIYITFAVNITRGCDCEPHPMPKCIRDIGVFASTDPVAIDQACFDAAVKNGKKFRGAEQLAYAEKCGLGTTAYELIQI
ncbi:MAG: DUF362 domain-containing protein [Lentisphaeria bacterium]|nr:DUF362 domain-containing protein [Lentisphaeria bacterium]